MDKIKKLKHEKKRYNVWSGIIERCTNEKYQSKKPTYVDCSIDERWKTIQPFIIWFEENYNPETMQGWHLDKDILVKGNKVYSPESCCFVPREINNLFTKCNSKRGTLPIADSKLPTNTYRAQITRNNVKIKLGTYKTPEVAFKVYFTAKAVYIKEVADK